MGDSSRLLVHDSAAQESKDSQSDPPSVTTSSSSTASPLLPVPLGTMIPNMWPIEVPPSVKEHFKNWEESIFIEVKDHLKMMYKRRTVISDLKDHLMYKTFPSDLGHKFVPCQTLPHTLHEEHRRLHQESEVSLFLEWKKQVLEIRVNTLGEDFTNAQKKLLHLTERTDLKDQLMTSSPSLHHFGQLFDAHFTAFQHRVAMLKNKLSEDYDRHVEATSARSLAARATADAAAAAAAAITSSNTSTEMDVIPPEVAATARPAVIPPGPIRRVPVTPAPVVTTEATAIAAMQAQLNSLTAALQRLTTAGVPAAPALARAPTPAAKPKGPKNSSGPGGKSTAQTSTKDSRSSRPQSQAYRKEDRHDRDSRSRDRRSTRSPSRQPYRSDSSRYKRQPSPSRDRDDDRYRSNTRPRTSRRTPSPPPAPRRTFREDRDRDPDRGRSHRRESSNRV